LLLFLYEFFNCWFTGNASPYDEGPPGKSMTVQHFFFRFVSERALQKC